MRPPDWQTPDGSVQLHCCDCLELLPTLEAGSVDAVVTDPDYGTGGWRRNASGNGSDPSAFLVREEWDEGLFAWVDGRWPTIAFCAPSTAHRLLAKAIQCGLTKHRQLYWRKPDPKPMPLGRIRWSVEPAWVLSRDGFQLYGGDDWTLASTPRMNRDEDAVDHPYQKPLEVLEWLLEKVPACLSILDPFMGSGTTGVACVRTGRRFIGCEIEEKYFKISCERIQREIDRFPLFEKKQDVQLDFLSTP